MPQGAPEVRTGVGGRLFTPYDPVFTGLNLPMLSEYLAEEDSLESSREPDSGPASLRNPDGSNASTPLGHGKRKPLLPRLARHASMAGGAFTENIVPGLLARNMQAQSSREELEHKRAEIQAQLDGWLTTTTKDDARDKAVASHETMGLVSALMAGFELQALVEIDFDASECGGGRCNDEGLFVAAAAFCVGLSTLVVLETSFEYMFVMRELHHGAASAWNLIRQFRFCRRIAEIAFVVQIALFLISTALMVRVRFLQQLPLGTTTALICLGINGIGIMVVVGMLQAAKTRHGQGARARREEALIEQQRLRARTRANTGFEGGERPRTRTLQPGLVAASQKVKQLTAYFQGANSYGENNVSPGGGAGGALTRQLTRQLSRARQPSIYGQGSTLVPAGLRPHSWDLARNYALPPSKQASAGSSPHVVSSGGANFELAPAALAAGLAPPGGGSSPCSSVHTANSERRTPGGGSGAAPRRLGGASAHGSSLHYSAQGSSHGSAATSPNASLRTDTCQPLRESAAAGLESEGGGTSSTAEGCDGGGMPLPSSQQPSSQRSQQPSSQRPAEKPQVEAAEAETTGAEAEESEAAEAEPPPAAEELMEEDGATAARQPSDLEYAPSYASQRAHASAAGSDVAHADGAYDGALEEGGAAAAGAGWDDEEEGVVPPGTLGHLESSAETTRAWITAQQEELFDAQQEQLDAQVGEIELLRYALATQETMNAQADEIDAQAAEIGMLRQALATQQSFCGSFEADGGGPGAGSEAGSAGLRGAECGSDGLEVEGGSSGQELSRVALAKHELHASAGLRTGGVSFTEPCSPFGNARSSCASVRSCRGHRQSASQASAYAILEASRSQQERSSFHKEERSSFLMDAFATGPGTLEKKWAAVQQRQNQPLQRKRLSIPTNQRAPGSTRGGQCRSTSLESMGV